MRKLGKNESINYGIRSLIISWSWVLWYLISWFSKIFHIYIYIITLRKYLIFNNSLLFFKLMLWDLQNTNLLHSLIILYQFHFFELFWLFIIEKVIFKRKYENDYMQNTLKWNEYFTIVEISSIFFFSPKKWELVSKLIDNTRNSVFHPKALKKLEIEVLTRCFFASIFFYNIFLCKKLNTFFWEYWKIIERA